MSAPICGRVYLEVAADKGRRCTMPADHGPAAGCCHTHEPLTADEVAKAQRQWMARYEAGIATAPPTPSGADHLSQINSDATRALNLLAAHQGEDGRLDGETADKVRELLIAIKERAAR